MSYRKWFLAHAQKHKTVVERLVRDGLPKEAIITYFRWENLRKKEPDFCPLFEESKKCHEMEQLNCYLCACPNFRFDDGVHKGRVSWCAIDSKEGSTMEHAGCMHQDCSACTVPHHEKYITDSFEYDWLRVMRGCDQGKT
jgi:hypothetical protein